MYSLLFHSLFFCLHTILIHHSLHHSWVINRRHCVFEVSRDFWGSSTEESDSRSSPRWLPLQLLPLCLRLHCTQTSAPANTDILVIVIVMMCSSVQGPGDLQDMFNSTKHNFNRMSYKPDLNWWHVSEVHYRKFDFISVFLHLEDKYI